MNCQEVMEFMQRYLDKDLEDTEHHALMQHVRQCPDCSELFARLIQMSIDLENLPKVTPAYSLVDAIMPRLDELDAGSSERETGGPVPVGPNEHRAAAEPKRRRRWIDRLSFRVAGGVVAAGLIVGFAYMYQNQTSMYNADGLLAPKAQKIAESTGGSAQDSRSSAKDDKAAAPAAEPKLFDRMAKSVNESGASSGTSASPSQPVAPVPAPTPAPAAKIQEQKGQDQLGQLTQRSGADSFADIAGSNAARTATPPASAGGAAPGGGAGGSAAAGSAGVAAGGSQPAERFAPAGQDAGPASQGAAESPAANSAPAKPDGAADASASQSQFTLSAPKDASGGAGQSADSHEQSAASAVQEKAPTTAPEEKGIASAETPKLKTSPTPPAAAGIMGIAAAEPESASSAMASKDGSYTARIADKRVVVYGRDGTTAVYTSERQWKESDVITLTGWTGDEFSYEVKSGTDETVKTYTIDAKTKKETEKSANR